MIKPRIADLTEIVSVNFRNRDMVIKPIENLECWLSDQAWFNQTCNMKLSQISQSISTSGLKYDDVVNMQHLTGLKNIKFSDIDDLGKKSDNLMVEYFGDSRASITRNKDGDQFNEYSNCNLSYRYSQEIHFVSNQKEPDKPIVLIMPNKNVDFDDQELIDNFYPTRETSFYVDTSNIKIGSRGKKEDEFSLDMTSDVVTSSMVMDMTNALERLGISKEDLQDLTEDDMNYTNNNTYDEEHHDPLEDIDEDDITGGLRNVQT